MSSGTGTLRLAPVVEHLDLVAPPVAAVLTSGWAGAAEVQVAEIDPTLADTAKLCDAYGVGLDASGNCVVVAGTRGGETRLAACVVLATTKADVNSVVRRYLDARKASFAPMATAVEVTGMEYGAITPIGLPESVALLIDPAVAARDIVVVGSGLRGSKLVAPGQVLATLPGALVIDGLGK